MTLALFGGKPAVETVLERYNSISREERLAVQGAVSLDCLSGYLGGSLYGGVHVQRLEELWAAKFQVAHAIACNSATSGLLAAAACFGKPGHFNVSPYTMSATAAAPTLLGHQPVFCDIAPDTFNIAAERHGLVAAHTVATNLFGHPAELHKLRNICDHNGTLLIEDNAQSPLAMENGKYAGTIGHIGVFSLNVHKHIQCGEGGVVVTNDRLLAERIRGFINHGEMVGQEVGLNLRMTEVTAAIAIEQLKKIEPLVQSRVTQAISILDQASFNADWLPGSLVRRGCTHVYYTVPFRYQRDKLGITRRMLAKALAAEGFPLCEGYVKPLYHLPAFQQFHNHCEVAERMHNEELIYFENCAWDVTPEQAYQFGQALKKIEDNIGRLRRAA